MAANVFFTIMPGQKALVKAAEDGTEVDGANGKKAFQRSFHNNYFTLPVMFIMISNHFPSTFGNDNQWLVLLGLTVASIFVKHWLNLKDQGVKSVWLLPAGAAILIGLIFYTAPKEVTCLDDAPIKFETINTIMQERCVSCHSANTTDDIFKVAQAGAKFDTPEEIRAKAELINARIINKTMPFGNNKTGMTDEERELVAKWFCQGAKIE